MRPVRLVAALIVALSAFADDAKLEALRQLLVPLRGEDPYGRNLDTRGATVQLTLAKHELRDWVESRLPPPDELNPSILASKLNAELRQRRFYLRRLPRDAGYGPSNPGYLGEVRISWLRPFLLVRTGFGIVCGFDESAYLYEWTGDHWRSRLETEQNTYTKRDYRPWEFQDILISSSNPPVDYLVLAVGDNPWCTSNWSGGLKYRLWRISPGAPQAKLLLDASEVILVFGRQAAVTLESGEILIRFTTADPNANFIGVKRHFRVDGDTIIQLDHEPPMNADKHR